MTTDILFANTTFKSTTDLFTDLDSRMHNTSFVRIKHVALLMRVSRYSSLRLERYVHEIWTEIWTFSAHTSETSECSMFDFSLTCYILDFFFSLSRECHAWIFLQEVLSNGKYVKIKRVARITYLA